VRENRNDALFLPYYGMITASNIDPIEKKPLAHFRPGSYIPSFGFTGCNLQCPFCQNWQISQNQNSAGELTTPQKLIRCVSVMGFPQVAYTYSEPLVHPEFLLACMHEAEQNDIANVLVTNGCAAQETADAVLRKTQAANIDLKCFSREKYRDVLGGDLDAVLMFIERAYALNVHIEVTTLVVTDFNDALEELMQCAQFIAGISPAIPWHITAYHPAWKYHKKATSGTLLKTVAERARDFLTNVHIGNVVTEKGETHHDDA
jgi:pyruvate formate lyase activating enzyme